MEVDYNTTILVSLFTVLAYLWWWSHNKSKYNNLPPGPRPFPILGNWEVIEHDARKLSDLNKIYGGIYSLQSFGKKFIVLNDWNIVKAALVDQSDIFSGRATLYVPQKLTKKMDIVTIDGPQMKERKALTMKLLRNLGFYKSKMDGVISDEVLKIFEFVDKYNGNPIQAKDMFFMPILNILFGILIGKTYQYDDETMNQKVHLMESIFDLLWKTMPVSVMPWLRFVPFDPFGYQEIVQVTEKINQYLEDEIEEHLQTFVDGNEPRDFIDAYLAEIEKINKSTNNSMMDERHPYQKSCLVKILLDLFMAGVETSKTTLEWGLLYMAYSQDKQQKVQQELDSVLGKNRLPTYADVSRLPYTEATIMEIHRCASVIPLGVPHRALNTTKLAGYTVLKDSTVMTNIWSVHHDKKLWNDPEIFRPERFINSKGQVEKPEYLIPFLIGGRACLGTSLARLQIFLIFTSLLQRYSISFVPGEKPPSMFPLKTISLAAATEPFQFIAKKR